ncbi:MAG: hypothetical protein LC663_04555, partial [Actinobacteria bacterium]|nr:hypothetical protein [Actinomycetota bacterium]
RQESDANVAHDFLPEEILAPLRAPGATVDVLPWEIAYARAHGLRWSPSPLLQVYNAATPRLDEENAAHFRGAGAPQYVLVRWQDIDERNLLLDAPRTWRAIFEDYSLVRRWRFLFLFRRRAPEPAAELRALGSTLVHRDEWIDVPRAVTSASMDFALGAMGIVKRTFLGVAPVWLDVRDESGAVASYRITPELARAPSSISGLASNPDTFDAYLHGRGVARAIAMRVRGPGARDYRWPVMVRWYRAS